jgi:hypothetical protein
MEGYVDDEQDQEPRNLIFNGVWIRGYHYDEQDYWLQGGRIRCMEKSVVSSIVKDHVTTFLGFWSQ